MLTKEKISKIKKIIVVDEKWPVVFDALSDRGRFNIFRLLIKHRGMCVSDIASILGYSLPAASQQFRVLERSGLVHRERLGQMICYKIALDDPMVRSVVEIIN